MEAFIELSRERKFCGNLRSKEAKHLSLSADSKTVNYSRDRVNGGETK